MRLYRRCQQPYTRTTGNGYSKMNLGYEINKDRLLPQPAFIYSAPETIPSRSAVRWLETATKFLLAQNQIFDERPFR